MGDSVTVNLANAAVMTTEKTRREILLEPVGHFDSDGHMDHKSVHDDINAVNQQLHDEEVEEAKELGLDDTSAQDTVAEQAE